jgi:hypothetical protein
VSAVGSAAAVLQIVQTDEWNANLNGALSVMSNLAVNVKNKANILLIAYTLHKSNTKLQAIFDDIHAVAEGKKAAQPSEPVTREKALDAVGEFIRVYRVTENLYVQMRRVGLTNNSLTAGQLLKLRAHGETILDLADWLDTSLHTEEVNAVFARSSEERDHGAIYDLEQVG